MSADRTETDADPDADPDAETEWLFRRLLAVRADAVAAANRHRDVVDDLPEPVRAGAENLLHYLAVRGVDLRREQLALAERGLSSLGRAEAHVLATVDAVLGRLANDLADLGITLSAEETLPSDLSAVGPAASAGRLALERHTAAAFGPAGTGPRTRVMVTLPTEAATDPAVADRFVAAGMAVARINAAHDDHEHWAAMAGNVRRAAERHRREVRIVVDLPGPKLRTGPVAPGPAVLRVRPERDDFGRVVSPGRLLFRTDEPPEWPVTSRAATGETSTDDVSWVVASGWEPAAMAVGDRIELGDARGRRRSLTVAELRPDGVVATTDRTVYLVPGLDLVQLRAATRIAEGRVVLVPHRPGAIRLAADDRLELRLGNGPGRDAAADGTPATVNVEVPELFVALGAGVRVLFDDGRIETVVEEATGDRALVRVVRPERATLREGKGVNVPDLDLGTMSPTGEDLEVLEHVAAFADLVALSYVGHPDEIVAVHRVLDRLGAAHVGTVLKIEHRIAFERLPELLVAALRRPPVAVMVARGDLAVEVGYERLAEVQEEVMWLSEAAHVPVIWATQVLESLAKRGAPTRAEVTDAAWAIRAECVMLNKGPFMAETIAFLEDVLGRMSSHRTKRMPMLRRLSVAASAWTSDVAEPGEPGEPVRDPGE